MKSRSKSKRKMPSVRAFTEKQALLHISTTNISAFTLEERGNYSGAWFPSTRTWGSLKDRCQSGQHGTALFPPRRKSAAKDAESRGTLGTANGSRHLLLNVPHPQVSFRLVGAQRHGEIVQERENLLGSRTKGIPEMVGVVVCAATRCCGDASVWRRSQCPMSRNALVEDLNTQEDQSIALLVRTPPRLTSIGFYPRARACSHARRFCLLRRSFSLDVFFFFKAEAFGCFWGAEMVWGQGCARKMPTGNGSD